MNQLQYELILKCIHHSMPALEQELTVALNNTVETANKYADEHKDDKQPEQQETKTEGEQ